jgi:hypothetical protein
MIGGALYVRVTLQGLARPCISLTSHLATFCTFADVSVRQRVRDSQPSQHVTEAELGAFSNAFSQVPRKFHRRLTGIRPLIVIYYKRGVVPQ